MSLWRDGKVVPPRKVDLCDSTLKSILVSSYKMNDGYFFVLSESSSDCLLCDTGKIIGGFFIHSFILIVCNCIFQDKQIKQFISIILSLTFFILSLPLLVHQHVVETNEKQSEMKRAKQ